MSYASLGASYGISIPGIGSQSVDIPVESIANDLVNNAVPALQAKLPGILSNVTPVVVDALNKQLPGLINKQVPVIVGKVMPEAKRLIDETVFPIKMGAIVTVLALIGTTIAAARWVKLGRIL